MEEHFGNTTAQEHLLNSEDALECKNIARDIRDFNRANWNSSAKSALKELNNAASNCYWRKNYSGI